MTTDLHPARRGPVLRSRQRNRVPLATAVSQPGGDTDA